MRFKFTMAAAAAALTILSGAADAAVIVNIAQVGGNVVATTTGTLNLTGLTLVNTGYSLSRGIIPTFAYVATGATDGATVTGYSGLAGPTSFGTSGTYTSATSGTGISFAINGGGFSSPYVFVPNGYTSGGALAGTSTFAGQTFASLGLTSGSYVFRSGSDTVTVNIGGATPAVPEPATWAMMLAGVGAVGFAMRRRAKVSTAVSFA